MNKVFLFCLVIASSGVLAQQYPYRVVRETGATVN